MRTLRALLRVPSLTAMSVLTVALGVGAGTALFSVVKAVLLNPLPYPEPDRLAWIAEVNNSGRETQVAYQNFLDWRSQNRSFSGMAAYFDARAVVSGSDLPQNTRAAGVAQDFFPIFRAVPAIGRGFSPEEQAVGGNPVVILGYSLWQRAFGGAPDVIGRTLHVFGLAPTIIGVMPRGFAYPENVELWLPITAFGDPGAGIRTGHNYRVVGRLRDGVSAERAHADVDAIEANISRQFSSPFQFKNAAVVPLQTHIVGPVRQPLMMLFGAVGFLLLIVCVNVANLLLVRVTGRARDFAVRTALGAGRRHLVRQMLDESLLLSLGGGVCGLLLAFWLMRLLPVILPADLPRAVGITIDAGVVAFAIAVSAAAGILFGVLPAWRASAMNIGEALKSGSRSTTAGRRSHRVQSALVVSEVCLSLVLVAGAGVLARSFWNLRAIDPGFRTDHVLTADAGFQRHAAESLIPKYRDLLGRLRSIPGVEAAAITRGLPIVGSTGDGHFFIEGRRAQTTSADADYLMITPGYLQAMRIPLLRGRDITEQDTENSQLVALITGDFARIYFPDSDPIGQRIWFDSFTSKEHWVTIVGVTGDVRQDALTGRTPPVAFVSYAQQQVPAILNGGTVVVRSTMPPASLAGPVRAAIRAVNPESAPAPRTLDSLMAGALAKQRFQVQLLGAFAVLALLLAAVGLYGVLSYMVTTNRGEIGIRLALGARRSTIFRSVAGRALGLAAIGVALGGVGCLAVRRVLATLLYGIGPNDPLTLAAAVAVLLLVALAAASFPALRATRVDPMSALREE